MISVRKLDGSSQPFSEDKIRSSATRVGVSHSLQEAMLEEVRSKLYDDIPTTKIFSIIKSYLAKSGSPHLAVKYNLKEALAELGPSGYPFEQYLAQLLLALGYTVKTNQLITGSCVTHEVDVVATKDGITHYVEAKFHSKPIQRTDVKVSLYIQARYEDISESHPGHSVPWIITNTRFTSEAIKYALCRGIKLTSWGYPEHEGIMDLIEKTSLHPITILTTLTKADMRLLFDQNIVTCTQLVKAQDALNLVPSSRREQVLAQATSICQSR